MIRFDERYLESSRLDCSVLFGVDELNMIDDSSVLAFSCDRVYESYVFE
jgi:hypothetical protein